MQYLTVKCDHCKRSSLESEDGVSANYGIKLFGWIRIVGLVREFEFCSKECLAGALDKQLSDEMYNETPEQMRLKK